MNKTQTNIDGLFIIENNLFTDNRGSFLEFWNKEKFERQNLIAQFAQDNISISKKNVIRGFHFQYKRQQAKQIIVLKGKILDCVIDLRKRSKTFGKSFKIFLSEKNNLSLYVPQGFAHSYLALDNENIVYYKLSNYYYPKYESGIIWDDKDLNINWPITKPKLSFKDKNLLTYKNFLKKYKGL